MSRATMQCVMMATLLPSSVRETVAGHHHRPSVWPLSFLLFLAVTSFLVGTTEGICPNRCECYRTTVRCMNRQLHKVIRVPAATTVLDLRSNKIKNISPGVFSNLRHLHTLLMNHNELTALTRNAFVGLPALRVLYLYDNKIETIQNGTFNELDNLKQLNLQNNQIERLPRGVFSNLQELRKLNLDGNPLVCDCNMYWLSITLRDMEEHGMGSCERPANLLGQSITSLSSDQFQCTHFSTHRPVRERQTQRTPPPSSNGRRGFRNRLPEFILEPENTELRIGSAVYFSCAAAGDPIPEIIWLHNNEVVLQTASITILDDNRLLIQNLQESNSGTYVCLARNAAGQIYSAPALLHQGLTPARVASTQSQSVPSSRRNISDRSEGFLQRPLDITSVQGQNIRLLCSGSGNPTPRISWTKDGQPLSTPDHITLLTTGALYIVNIRQEDQGLYRCTATSSSGVYTAESRVTVQVPPSFTEPPSDQTAVEGVTVIFRCRAQGNPVPIISWTKDSEALPNNGQYEIFPNVLRILRVRLSDRGLYICRAENTAGRRETTAELAISPRVAPSIVHRQRDIDVNLGSRVSLICDARGEPAPIYRWVKNQLPLQYNRRIQSQGNALVIQRVIFRDAGRYECVAENIEGIDRSSFRLNILSESRSYAGNQFVTASTDEAINRINSAANATFRHLFDKRKTHTIQDLLSIVRYPSPESLELAKAEEIFERTLDIIYQHVKEGHKYNLQGHNVTYRELVSPEHIRLIANLSGCFRRTPNIDCSDMCFHKKYRSFDGTCNNLQNPTYGSSNRAFKRLLPARYENGFNTPVGWNPSKEYHGIPLPSPRLVSSLLIGSNHVTDDDNHTHMLMQWGQFLDHDMDLAPQSISNTRFSDGRRCNETCENDYPCFPIPVPRSDQRIRNTSCLGFSRSSALCNTGGTSIFFNTVSPREQLNALTAFIDASNVYGSTPDEASSLRDLTTNRGLLRVGASPDGKGLLPFDTGGLLANIDCQAEANKRHLPCFLAGDHRVNEQLALTAMHTMWLRQHNRIATELLQLNPHWDGSLLYHETRKIVGAMMQHITFQHWLPYFLGTKGMEMLGEYKGYDPQVNPTIANEFATAAFRVGHTLIQPVIYRLNEAFQPIRSGNLPLHRAFFSPYRIVEEGGIDPLLRGLFAVPAKKQLPKEMFNEELTERLFELANSVGQDLASLNIQRGRDHGLPSYNDYRVYCGLPRAATMAELKYEITHNHLRTKLQNLYLHPDNIDLFVGGICETPMAGSKVGPTFQCLIGDQFRRLRNGDRFWYENPGVFTSDQLTQLKQVTLARVICDNSDNIERIQRDVFHIAKSRDYFQCEEIPKIDLKMWSDCCYDCHKSGEFQSITSHYRSRRSTHSYPEDSQLRQSVPQSQQLQRDTPVLSTNATAFYTSHQVQTDLFDARIQGMETVIKKLGRMVHKLKKQMFGMQKRMHKSPLKCFGNNGKNYSHLEEWKVNDCKVCTCKNGQVECQKEMCPTPSCSDPQKIEGVCCLMC